MATAELPGRPLPALGSKVRETVTGLEGTVTGHAVYLGQEARWVQIAAMDSTGRPIEDWYPLNRIEDRR